MPASCYIYYRIAPEHVHAAEECVYKLLESVKARSGIEGRLMKKRALPEQWMEIYEGAEDEVRFEIQLEEALRDSGLSACLQAGSVRHLECFYSADNGL